MNRKDFLKSIITSLSVVAAPSLLLAKNKELSNEYSFDELFIVHKGNERLIYPKKESFVYKSLEQSFIDNIDSKKYHTYLPVHHLSLSVKEKYKIEDFLPIKFLFSGEWGYNHKHINWFHKWTNNLGL